jgi:hypothetical protein
MAAPSALANVAEVLTDDVTLVDATGDPQVQIPGGENMVVVHDVGAVDEEDTLSDSTPVKVSPPGPASPSTPVKASPAGLPSPSTTAPPDVVVEPITLEAARSLLKTDYEERLDSGLDVSSTIREIDQMAEADRYGEFGRRKGLHQPISSPHPLH